MPVPVELSKLSDVVKNDVVKKDVYDRLVAKVNNIDTSRFVLKTKYDTDKLELDNKIPDISGLVKKTDYDSKITDIEGKIPDVSGLATKIALNTVENKIPDVTNLATKTALTAVDNKIPDVSSLVKKTDHSTKIAEINAKVPSLNGKIDENKSIGNELIEPIKDILSFWMGSIAFNGGDGFQAYLIFKPVHRYVKIIANTKYITEWKSKGLSDESIKPLLTSDNSLTPLIDYYNHNITVKFNGRILRQSKFHTLIKKQ